MSTQPTGEIPQTTEVPAVPAWTSYIGAFAQAVGKEEGAVTEALKGLAGEPGQNAIEVLSNEEFSSFSDIETALASLGIAKGVLKKAVSKHLRQAPAAPQATFTHSGAGASFDALPAVPDDEAWLAALKTGGILKVTPNNVICGMRAALASRSGLFDLPARLTELMERHAEGLAEPVGADYFELNDLLTRRNYAEIFSALGIDGRKYASVKRKGELVRRLDETLWPALLSFQSRLKGWVDAWQQSFNNPGAAMGFLAAAMSGRGGGALPPGMTEAPPTDVLHDAADTVINDINRCFAGVGIPVAMAMAFDAQCIKKVLENPNLPIHIGAANRDQMLKLLAVDVAPDYVRLERNISRYALAVMEFPNVTADAELAYLTSLLMLGSQIPWDRLGTPPRRPSASKLQESESDDDDDRRPPRRTATR